MSAVKAALHEVSYRSFTEHMRHYVQFVKTNRGAETTRGSSYAFLETLRTLASLSPWTWVGFLFAIQAAGSMVVAWNLELPPGDVALPILILCAGVVIALVFRVLDRENRLGAWKWWLAPITYGTFILCLSSRSFEVPSTSSFNGNYFHPVEYMTLGFLACLAWHPLLARKSTGSLFLAVMLCGLLFSISDEVTQDFIPGRTMSVVDVCLDVLGLTIGFGAFVLFQRMRRLAAG